MPETHGFQDTQPAPLHEFGDAANEFRISAPAEVASMLRQLIDGGVPVHLNAPDGSNCTTTLWTLDRSRGRLSLSGDDDVKLQRLIDADEAVAVAYLENVKLQFDLSGMVLVRGHGSVALQADLPTSVYRFQRRDSFRVRPGGRGAAVALVRHPSMPDMLLTLRLLDVSIGGCALFVPDDVPAITPGLRLHGVRIELDADARFSATLLPHHVTSINPHSQGSRLGCSWEDIGGEGQRALQRYIDQTQKRRRLLQL